MRPFQPRSADARHSPREPSRRPEHPIAADGAQSIDSMDACRRNFRIWVPAPAEKGVSAEIPAPSPARPCRARVRPLDLVSPAQRRLRPPSSSDMPQPGQQVRAVDEPARDEVDDRHLCLLCLALDPTLDGEQPGAEQRGAVAVAVGRVDVDHDVGLATPVLDRDEDDALGRPGRWRISISPVSRIRLPRDRTAGRRVSCMPNYDSRGRSSASAWLRSVNPAER